MTDDCQKSYIMIPKRTDSAGFHHHSTILTILVSYGGKINDRLVFYDNNQTIIIYYMTDSQPPKSYHSLFFDKIHYLWYLANYIGEGIDHSYYHTRFTQDPYACMHDSLLALSSPHATHMIILNMSTMLNAVTAMRPEGEATLISWKNQSTPSYFSPLLTGT